MIDIGSENLLTFRDAAEWLPRRSRGRKVAITTLWRWSTYGVKGVRLETARIGRLRMTSREALQRFSNRLAERNGDGNHVDYTAEPLQTPHGDSNAAAELGRSGW